MPHLTREQILSRKTGRGVATLPDGSTVAIRALTRDEVLRMQSMTEAEADIYAVSCCITDPVMSIDDVRAWSANADAGDIQAVVRDGRELSGLGEGAGKSSVDRPG